MLVTTSANIAKIAYLDGIRLYRAIVAGIRQVISKQEYLNEINVFPVPDRDTGTNMALTLNAVLESTYFDHNTTIHALLENVADAALNGARGNSGAILAQFFQGLSEGAKNVNQGMTTKNFVAAIATAVNFAHKALSEPKEGTILTILRDFSDEITHRQLENNDLDFVDLLRLGIARANQSLARTTMQLKSLKKAGVVDAGAQGFVEFLKGIYVFVQTGSIKRLQEEMPTVSVIKPTDDMVHDIDERYRFCTECLINRTAKPIDHDSLRATLNDMGNSLIVAGSTSKTKVHMHTNDPNAVFTVCREYGALSGEKADDMIHQQKSYANRATRVAILTDSSADLPPEIFSDNNIHVVPIIVSFGQTTYLDKVSMTAKEFHDVLQKETVHPTTSQPSFGDFHRQYQYLSTHFDSVIALHVPNAVSGTMSVSRKAAEKIGDKANISVIDTFNASAGQGLVVLYAAEAAAAGFSKENVIALTEKIIPKTQFYAAIPSLDFLVKGGRLAKKYKKLLDFLNITPVVSPGETGQLKLGRLLLGKKNMPKKMLRLVKAKIEKNKKYRFAVVHVDREQEAQTFAALLKEKYANQIDQLFILPCCASLAVHAGPGALGIGIQEYMPLLQPEAKQ